MDYIAVFTQYVYDHITEVIYTQDAVFSFLTRADDVFGTDDRPSALLPPCVMSLRGEDGRDLEVDEPGDPLSDL